MASSGIMEPQGGDRFSDLPDNIIHHILSFLDIKDMACISILSRRCRELCLSAPNLIIDSKKIGWNDLKRQQFCNFLDRFMYLQNGMELKVVCICWVFPQNDSGRNEEFRVDTWIHNVVRSNVKRLGLKFQNRISKLPLCLSGCGSLKVLTLEFHGGILKLPSAGFPTLQYLSIKFVKITGNYDLGEWISSLCKSLTTLYLLYIRGIKSLGITSSSLRSLTIKSYNKIRRINVVAEKLQSMGLFWIFVSSTRGTSFNVSAPNLRLMKLEGAASYYYAIPIFNRLRIVEIFFFTPPSWLKMNQSSIDLNLLEISRFFSHAEVLYLGGKFIQILITKGFPTTALHNIGWLFVNVRCLNDKLVPSITAFLMRLPSLQKLVIKSHKEPAASNTKLGSPMLPLKASRFDAEYWESKDRVFVHRLRMVEIEVHSGENEMQLVKYLLKHAKALKKITIFCSPLTCRSTTKDIIEEFKRASSSSAVVDVLPK